MFRSLSVLFAKSTKKAAPPTRRKVLKRSPTKKPSRGGKQTRSRAGSLAKRKKTEAKEEKSLAVTSTHVDPETNMVRMVDISNKRPSYRLATAVATVVVPPTCTPVLEGMRQVLSPAAPPKDGKEAAVMEEYYTSKKGPLFATAVIAGTNAVKQCSQMIPFCHPIPIQRCSFTFRRRIAPSSAMNPSALPHRVVLRKRHSTPANMPNHPEFSILYCFCTVATDEYKTGVEMEALTGATVASLTLYDMLKGMPGAQEDGLGLGEAFLLAKRAGKNDFIKLLMSEPAQPGTEQKDTPQISPTPAAAEAAPKEDKKEAKTEEAVEEEEEEEPPAKATPKAKRPNVVKRSAPAAPEAGDETGAWWRSSRKEKRLQEMNPRRKYGDNARVVIPTAPEKKKPAGKQKQRK
ncbi:molybdenum cofactor biosynthesis protein C [Angomonas deanei]|uniref:MoaC family, putative n=1 Tax=Angomonas deanei TaxID=59799 RepID=A0A7G2CGW1_9TRYP|nr:molybdenum cofactor biosynthesis protein C [Angomonas deanei]CAD2218739.1 MoaC family, putative [Angomonas deanei]|eukprot:EPY23225.1 molybdenum cofactor biosynthesis protein C [Angomonas deanei]